MNAIIKVSKPKITFKTHDSIHVIDVNKILYFKVYKKNTSIHYIDGTVFTLDLELEQVEKELGLYHFWRTDKNHIIHLKYLENVPGNGDDSVKLRNNILIPIDQKRRKMLIETLSEM